jgi:hypothetical protein
LNPNDAIAEANLNLRSFYNRAYKNKSDRESLEQQWVSMTHPAAQGVQGNKKISDKFTLKNISTNKFSLKNVSSLPPLPLKFFPRTPH